MLLRLSVRPLVVHAASAERVIVGRIAHPSALVAIEAAKQAAVIAAPQVGKTSGLIIPAVLEHDGPVAVTSTKTDVVLATIARRRRMGEVFVSDVTVGTGAAVVGRSMLRARGLGRVS